MKRRRFCASGLAMLAAAGFPYPLTAAPDGELVVTGLDGRRRTLRAAEIEDLRASLSGSLLLSGEDGYDSARRIWNGAFDRKPALIARCSNAMDVTRAVGFAAAHEILTAVRAGGHSLSGQCSCDGGLVIDLSPMTAMRVDPSARRAVVAPGVLLGQFDRETLAHGLATTSGTVSHTGVSGLTLGGGFGRLARKYGLACDNLMGVELITAAGRVVRANAEEDPALLWGLRGGGGNFGVVTSLEFMLHPVAATMLGGQLAYPFPQARDVLRGLADLSVDAPQELYVEVSLEANAGGTGALRLDVCHCGSPTEAQRSLAALRKLGKPSVDQIAPARYVDLQSRSDGSNPHGRSYYVKSGYLRALTPEVIDATVECLASAPLPRSHAGIVPLAGAIARVPPTGTAYWHRNASHALLLVAAWEDRGDAEAATRWIHERWSQLEPLTTGFYVNLSAGEDAEHRAHAAYGDNYGRLAALKRRHDPRNLFRLNTNVMPA